MLLIVISPEQNLPHEHSIINTLFATGLTHFHLRKPGFTQKEIENYLDLIPVKYHHRIVIHSHYELALRYHLKGIHLTEKSKQQRAASALLHQLTDYTLSAAFHSINDLQLHRRRYDYVFLSPVFDSISKQNYTANFDEQELMLFSTKFRKQKNYTPVVALGGVTINNIAKVKKIGFAGAAVLGGIWEQEEPLYAFNMLQSRLKG
jgi:thiamine-phosphate pyrophosphorylase